jgi:putative transposase
VLVAAGQHLGEDDSPTVVADSGVENVNRSVDATLAFAKLRRALAQVEVTYSNSIIEAWWRSLKHQWLYLNTLDTMAHLETLIAFFVEEHNAKMPHSAFTGQTPDEIYLGTANSLPDELVVARGGPRTPARREPSGLLPSMCPGHRPSQRQHAILRDSLAVALANAKLQDVLVNSTGIPNRHPNGGA